MKEGIRRIGEDQEEMKERNQNTRKCGKGEEDGTVEKNMRCG
jgi:hypothetical protein